MLKLLTWGLFPLLTWAESLHPCAMGGNFWFSWLAFSLLDKLTKFNIYPSSFYSPFHYLQFSLVSSLPLNFTCLPSPLLHLWQPRASQHSILWAYFLLTFPGDHGTTSILFGNTAWPVWDKLLMTDDGFGS